MMRSLPLQTIAVVVILLMTTAVFSDDKDKDKQPPIDLAAYAKFAQPGPEHKLLEPMIGNWSYKVRLFVDPSKPPMEMTGKCEKKWILGNRYVQEHFKGDEKDHPFEGIGTCGYDVGQKKFLTSFVDNMGTGIMNSTGTADSKGKVFTFSSECYDPVLARQCKGREVLTFEDNDKHNIIMYRIMPDGKEMKVMELYLTRAKK